MKVDKITLEEDVKRLETSVEKMSSIESELKIRTEEKEAVEKLLQEEQQKYKSMEVNINLAR